MVYIFYREKKFAILLSGLIPLVSVITISTYNYHKTGYFHYSSVRNNSLVYHSANLLLIKLTGDKEDYRKIEEIKEYLNSINDYAFKCSEEERIGKEIILNNKIDYAELHIKGMISFFMDPGRYDLINFLGRDEQDVGLLMILTKNGYKGIIRSILNQPFYIMLYFILVLLVNVVMFASLLYLPFIKKIDSGLKIYIFLLILYIVFFTGALGAMRYKVPLFPIILFTIPFLFNGLRSRFLKSKITF